MAALGSTKQTAAPTQAPETGTFWYGSFSGIWVYYLVDMDTLQGAMGNDWKFFRPYEFGKNQGLVGINFMCYGAHSGQGDPQGYLDIRKPIDVNGSVDPASLGVEPSAECELNVVVYPLARAAQAPGNLSVGDFILGNDHTKTLGNLRLFVPCDDRIAVYWGYKHFGERKFMTNPFLYNVPSPNNFPTSTYPNPLAWNFIVPGPVSEDLKFNWAAFTYDPYIFSLRIDVSSLAPALSNASEIIDYSGPNGPLARPAGSRRNMFGPFSSYDLTQSSPTSAMPLELTIGNSSHPMVPLMKQLGLASATIAAVQTFHSQPVIAESSMYYVDV